MVFFKGLYVVINWLELIIRFPKYGKSHITPTLGSHFVNIMTNGKATHLSQPFSMYQAVRPVKAAVETLDWEEEEEELPGSAHFSLTRDP